MVVSLIGAFFDTGEKDTIILIILMYIHVYVYTIHIYIYTFYILCKIPTGRLIKKANTSH